MRQAAEHHSYVGSGAAVQRRGLSPACHIPGRRVGFTLIELIVALAVLMIVMIGVLSSVAFAYTSSMQNEQLNVARSVASYGVEYLRARTVTRTNNLVSAGTTGGSGLYYFNGSTASDGAFPSMVDAWGLPLQSWEHDCSFSKAHVLSTTSIVDGSANTDGSIINFASRNPALPSEAFADLPLAWSSTLQGFNSVRDLASISALVAQDPSDEDANLQRTTCSGNDAGYYRSVAYGGTVGCHLTVVFPGTYVDAANPGPVTSFQALNGYVPMVYTADQRYTQTDEQVYDPHYTNDADLRSATQAYRGYRLLTTVVARVPPPIPPALALTHVQYYDVTVTVFWMTGTRESRYALSTQIVAY